MKTCPYCAEEIKDAAIVCRYCGRDLPVIGKVKVPTTKAPSSIAQKQTPSAWSQGAKVSLVFTALTFVSIFVRYKNAPAELMGSIFFGLPITFVVWWLLTTGVIALWRKGTVVFMAFVGGAVLIIAAFALLWGNLQNLKASNTPLPTSTPLVTATRIFLPTPSTAHLLPTATNAIMVTPTKSCINWAQVDASFEGRRVCVSGIVVNYLAGTPPYRCKTYFSNEENTFFAVDCFPTRPKIGDCISVVGIVQLNTYKTPYIQWDNYWFCNP